MRKIDEQRTDHAGTSEGARHRPGVGEGPNRAEVGEGGSEALFTLLEMLEVMGVGKRKKYDPVAIW